MKVAIIVLAGTETHEGWGRLVNALEVAKEFKEGGDEVTLVFDGAGTQGLAEVLIRSIHPIVSTWRCKSRWPVRVAFARGHSACVPNSKLLKSPS